MASTGGDAVDKSDKSDSPGRDPTSSKSPTKVVIRNSEVKVELEDGPTGRPVITKSGTTKTLSTRGPRKSFNNHDPGSMRYNAKNFLDSSFFKVSTMFALFVALFGGSLFIICDVPDNPGTAMQDILMIIVLLIFSFELVMRCWAEFLTYPLSFFFWMDTLGTLSMLFEISYFFGSHGKMDDKDAAVNTLLLRLARVSKVGARAGRFSKVVKVLNFLHRHRPEEAETHTSEAKILNAKLMMVLSSKVAMLTIILIMGVPLLNIGRYPVDDLSLRAWSRTMEHEYAQAYDNLTEHRDLLTVDNFEKTTIEFRDFYSDLWYAPYKLEGYTDDVIFDGIKKSIPGNTIISASDPDRKDFIVKQHVSRCRAIRPECEGSRKAAIFFDFGQSKKFEAAMDLAMIIFVIMVMALESADLSQTLDRMVVKPVERMLGTVRMMAKVLSLVTDINPTEDDEDFNQLTDADIDEVVERAKSPVISEAELLETVFSKLAKLTAVFMHSSIVDEADMASMDYESKGVLMEVMQMATQEQRVMSQERKAKQHDGPVVTSLTIQPADIESFELNMLEVQREAQNEVVTFVFFDSEIGKRTGSHFIDVEVFATFLQAVRTGYHAPNPYHNFVHACDVVCVTFRILLMVRAMEWLSDVDMCALLIAALCHDIGHQGKTNPFLTETSHELAMRYNDKSPLENMHSARLFEICKDPLTNVFLEFDTDSYKQARKVCISAILHTDNAHHFDMVKDIKRSYDMSADICDSEARLLRRRSTDEEFSAQYKEEVLQKDPVLWLKLVLHLADISNPLKPFRINQQWATRVQDEFFLQGDEEKRLGIPVGMLNDRDKVNRAGSEHGFINFLVSPLVLAAIGCFPLLHPLGSQMAINMTEWRNYWVEQSSPKEDDIKKRDDDIQKVKDKVDELKDRKAMPTVRTAKTKDV